MHAPGTHSSTRRLRIPIFVVGIALLGTVLAILTRPAGASPSPLPADLPQNEACLTCHGRPGQQRPLPDGGALVLTIDPAHYDDSVHSNLPCTDCHTTISQFPHPELTARSAREYTLEMYTVCQACHAEQYDATLDSVHQRALAGGNTNAAVCTDCHNPHTQTPITDRSGTLLPEARLHIPQTCARCHSTIYDQYAHSVHGAALTGEGNPDVPTCMDCHGVHDIGDPTTNEFRLNSPLLCAGCHTDPERMQPYGISTQVLNTYVADFHGTTVTLFESTSPDQPTNKPVCYDCHGIHAIAPVDDPVNGLAMKENILIRCQQCHPDASANFPDAWMSHYIPDSQNYPLVYYVNLFYKFFIPGVLGPMILFVISDFVRRLIDRRKGAKRV
ncbi:MAG: hypothetical protein JXB85_02415 [Anaerolineales bacterium]|nr:hypothetical protein [Anaerolineales bacterium]